MLKVLTSRILLLATLACAGLPSLSEAAPMLFDIPSQPQFGTLVSGQLTFDPTGVYFAGPFDISVGPIVTSAGNLPAAEFTDLNTNYNIYPNTTFHALWVFHSATPFDQLFLNIGYDSCSAGTCIFEMNYYQAPCSDCPRTASVQGAILGANVPEPSSLLLLVFGLAGLLGWQWKQQDRALNIGHAVALKVFLLSAK